MGCENNCVNEHRIKNIEEKLKEMKSSNSEYHKEFYNRIEKLERDMVESENDRVHITEKLDEIGENVKSLMEKPAKRYETIVTSVLTAVIGALVGFLLSGVI